MEESFERNQHAEKAKGSPRTELHIEQAQTIWLEGDPFLLLDEARPWSKRLRSINQAPDESYGLRLRFVLKSRALDDEANLSLFLREVLAQLEKEVCPTYLRSELMLGEDAGLSVIYENRPIGLLTQMWFPTSQKQEPQGKFPALSGPYRVNVLLHDRDLKFLDLWSRGFMDQILERIPKHGGRGFELEFLHELNFARSDAYTDGISVGLERSYDEHILRGGHPAKDINPRYW